LHLLVPLALAAHKEIFSLFPSCFSLSLAQNDASSGTRSYLPNPIGGSLRESPRAPLIAIGLFFARAQSVNK
jgi:hypothetical protein